MKYYIPLITIILSALIFSANAENKNDTIRILNEVSIVEKSAKAPIPLLPMDVKIIESSAIEKSTETNMLPVLQNRIPGLFVTERGLAGYSVSGGSAGQVSIRGVGGGNKVLFLIDGQPQWAGVFGHALPDTYVTNDIERVEVVSGPSSILYGSGAMGGSVNLITRRASKTGFTGYLRAMGGSYSSQKYDFRAGYKQGNFSTVIATNFESTKGNRKGADFRLANQYLSLNYDISGHWQTGVNAMITETKADNPGSVYREEPLGMWAKQLRLTTSLFVKNQYELTSGGFNFYYNWGKHDIEDGLDNKNQPRTYLFHSKDYNMGITLYQTVKPWTGNNLSLGMDFKHWGGEAYNTAKSDGKRSLIVDKHVNEIAGYVMMQQSLFHNILNLNAGIRLEHSSQFGNEWVPSAGFILRPITGNRVKFNFSKGFRSPNIRELYMYGPRNSALQPESMHNFEVEIRQWLIRNKLEIGLALYYIHGDNLIQTKIINDVAKNVNSGKFINKGFEIDISYIINSIWSLNANYAYLHTNKRLTEAPRNKFFCEVNFTPGNWEFSLNTFYIQGLNTENSRENYALLNSRVAFTFPFKRPLTLFAKGENLTATKYQINYGFPMPKATVMAGVEWKF